MTECKEQRWLFQDLRTRKVEVDLSPVRQAAGLKLWTLPGGKVKRGESLVKALKREVYEVTALRVQIGSLLGVLDRRDLDLEIAPRKHSDCILHLIAFRSCLAQID